MSLIHQATKKGLTSMIKFLVDYAKSLPIEDEDISKWINEFIGSNNDGRTPLHLAAFANNMNMIYTLIEHGADINITSNKN